MDNLPKTLIPSLQIHLPTEDIKYQPTAAKQNTNIIVQEHREEMPRLSSTTPTRPESLLQNFHQPTYHQENIFLEAFSGTREKNQRKKKLKTIIQKLGSLEHRVNKLEKTQNKINKQKRIRRKNSEMQKLHQCPEENCSRKYASETALKQHHNFKHKNKISLEEKIQKD